VSYRFNGSSQWMEHLSGSPVSSHSAYTMIAWVKVNNNGNHSNDQIISTSINYDSGSYQNYYTALMVNSSEQPRARTRHAVSGDFSSVLATTMSSSTWTLIHGVWASDSSRQVGLSGTSFATAETSTCGSMTLAPNRIQIARQGATTTYFSGDIALIAWYSRALTNAELVELNTYQPESASTYGDCVAYWDFRTDNLTNRKNPGTYDLTAQGSPTYVDADYPTLGAGSGGRMAALAAYYYNN
jgi:hypothetical protein